MRSKLIIFLAALSLFFSTIEYMFPKPFPFFRLGLANLVALVFINFLSFRELMYLGLLKALSQGVVNGTLLSYVFLFSLISTFASHLSMYFASRIFKKNISYLGISIIGAFFSTLSQFMLALYFIFGESAYIISLAFFPSSFFASLLVGILAMLFDEKSKWVFYVKTTF